MNKMPSGSWTCCLPSVQGITYLKLGPQGDAVGMMGLDAVFRQLYSLGRQPDGPIDAELVSLARNFNYIPSRESIEAEYAAALRLAYAAYCADREQKR